MVGGSQSLTIYNWGYKFIIAHEIGHALGLTHEHQRSDQADFINILEANIDSNICDAGCIASNFHLESTTDLTTYDFSSVMHYAKDAFAKPGLNTIEPKPAYSDFLDSMGQRTHLSNPDKQGMLTRYSSPVPSLTSLGVVILSILIALTGWLLYRKAKRPVSL